MTTQKQIIMSVASISAAMQAFAAGAAQQTTIEYTGDSPYDEAARIAMDGARPQAMLRMAMPEIAGAIKLDRDLGHQVYVEVAQFSLGGLLGGNKGGTTNNTGGTDTGTTGDTGASGDTGGTQDPTLDSEEQQMLNDLFGNEIPPAIIDYFGDTNDGGDSVSGDDVSSFGSAQEMVDALGLQVPEGQTAEEFIATLDSVYSDIFQPIQDAIEYDPIVLNSSGGSLRDSTTGSAGFFSCYSNCHSNCHGSRGWR